MTRRRAGHHRRARRHRPDGLGDGARDRPCRPAAVVNNRSPERAQALADQLGARVAASPADVAAAADVTLTMLADDAAVR